MKKSFFYAAMLAVAVAFVGCKDTQTPITDTTKLWPAMSGDNWGYIDAKGNMVISPMYEWVRGFSCGYALVMMEGSDKPIFINTKGNMQQASFDQAESFYYNYALVEMNDLCGLMTTSFDFSCQPMFHDMGVMSENGLVAAQLTEKDKWGYVNAKGENKIAAIYDEAYNFEGGVAVVRIGDKYGAIDTKGKYVIQPTHDGEGLWSIGHGLIAFYQNDRIGLMDANGKVVVQPIYYGFEYLLDNDLILAYGHNEKCGYINKSGDEKIPFLYDWGTPFLQGYAVVSQSDVERLIDTKGKIVMTLPKGEEFCTLMYNGLICVVAESNNKLIYKYVDKDYKVVYQWTATYSDGGPMKKVSRQERIKNLLEQTIHFDSRNL